VVAEVKRRRERITGITDDKPFDSAADFKQYLSLSMQTSETFKEESNDDPDAAPRKPGKNKNKDPQNA